MSTANMTNFNFDNLASGLNLDSKKNKNISTIISVVTHLTLIALIKFGHLFSGNAAAPAEENYIDLGYQTLNEVPVVKQVVTKTEEMQDQTSEVHSLKKEQPPTPATAPSTATQTFTDVPYYKIKPKYPQDALSEGLEGFVKMSIDILEDGTVENIKVIGGEKVGTFESAATRSVAKWKYKPFTDASGKPIKKQNHLVQVDFKLKDELASN